MMPVSNQLKTFLDAKAADYNQPWFIASDPVSIPHMFTARQDIEIAGFFAAVFSWGARPVIISKSKSLLELMDMSPYDFMVNHQEKDLKRMLHFKHRTFNPTDLLYFISFLQHHYQHYHSLEDAFFRDDTAGSNAGGKIENGLNAFYQYFFCLEDAPERTRKHVACPAKHSTCKRLNMFLRWMVRKDDAGVDFGIWNKVTPSELIIPVDLHVMRVANRFNLLQRKQADWLTAVELTESLRALDPKDPVKYDFALFGLGIMEKY